MRVVCFKRNIVLLLCCLVCSFACAQDSLSRITPLLDSLAGNRAQQVVYLQLSKGIYETGEDLWFKGYILNARYHEPSIADTTLYVQLRHSITNNIVVQEKVLISNGFADGHLIIRDTVPPGDYILMAFTAGSFLNDDEEFKAFRKLRIMERIDAKSSAAAQPKKLNAPDRKEERFSISFFPEGGHLVAGQVNCLAFKVNRNDGTPADMNGVLLEDGKPISSILTSYGGMGKINFKPVIGKKYAVKTTHSDTLYQLPQIRNEGIVLRLINQNEQIITFLVTKSNNTANNNIIISSQVRGTICALYKGEMTRDTLVFSLPKSKFPQGIVEVTLYTSDMTPLLERLVYVNLDQKINISVQLSKPAYERKDKVTVNIKATNEKGEPVIAHFGISVYDELYKNQQDFLNIVSYTHLHTQIKGEIPNPDYFFDANNKDREQTLDLLLLTQGWRKYVWGGQQLMKTAKVQEYIGDKLEGKITSKTELPKMLLTFTLQDIGVGNPVLVSASGYFQLSPEQMQPSGYNYIYVKPLGNETVSKNAKLAFTKPFTAINSALLHKKIVYPVIARKDKIDTLKVLPNIPGLINLNEVEIKGRGTGSGHRDKYMAKLDSTARFSGNFDFVGACGWLNCGSCGSGSRPVEGIPYTKYKDGRIHRHGSFNPNEIVKEPYKYPEYTDEELLKLFNIHRTQGFTHAKVFYSPDYELRPEEKNILDFRNTLIWKPAVISDDKGEASITFYSSDISGKFIGNIEGVDATGRLGQVNFNLKVNDTATGK